MTKFLKHLPSLIALSVLIVAAFLAVLVWQLGAATLGVLGVGLVSFFGIVTTRNALRERRAKAKRRRAYVGRWEV